MKKLSLALMLSLSCLFGSSLYAAYDGGSGSNEDPYQIQTAEHMNEIGLHPEDWNSYFVLVNDIDMSAYTGTAYNIIGNATTPFAGNFNGNGRVIRNLAYTTTAVSYNIGLFGYTNNATIGNVGLENVNISSAGQNLGGLAGRSSSSNISNCYSTGQVNGSGEVGGLIGWNQSSIIIHCYSNSSVNGSSYVGGLVGDNMGYVSVCYSTGSVSGSNHVGGLTGYSDGHISHCYAAGAVSGSSAVGGLVGSSSVGTVLSSFWDKNTSGCSTSAGGTGKTTAEMKTLSTFTSAGWDFVNETANGTCNYWLMPQNSYPVFAIFNGFIPPEPSGSGTEEAPYMVTDSGELGTIWYRPSSYYILANDINLVGIQWSMAVISKFNGVLDGKGHKIIGLTINGGSNYYVGLFGQISSGCQVKNLALVNGSVNGKRYVGELAGYNAGVVDNCYSTGTVSGSSGYAGGLVGYNFSGSISNCNSTCSVGSSSGIGGLAGYNGSSISNCYSTGAISGSSQVGGLVGNNVGAISNCFSIGIISGSSQIGGLAGNSAGSINYCYSTSSVSGSYEIGGLVGYNTSSVNNSYSTGASNSTNYFSYHGGLIGRNSGGTIRHCYSTGKVSCSYDGGSSYIGGIIGSNNTSAVSSFWNTQTCGQKYGVGSGSAAGTFGKTTAEMKMLSTFTDAGWDFANETANGTNDYWRMCTDGIRYPRLTWQYVGVGDFACPDGVWMEDLLRLSQDWLSIYSAMLYGADANGDKAVNLNDFTILATHWLEGIE